MAFGQPHGRPASHRQVQALEAALLAAGYDSFRDARGALGFTQRQANGKFTTDEADAFLERLEQEAADADGAAATSPEVTPVAGPAVADRSVGPFPVAGGTAAERRAARQAVTVRDVGSVVLARELERRGWIVIPPEPLTPSEPPAG